RARPIGAGRGSEAPPAGRPRHRSRPRRPVRDLPFQAIVATGDPVREGGPRTARRRAAEPAPRPGAGPRALPRRPQETGRRRSSVRDRGPGPAAESGTDTGERRRGCADAQPQPVPAGPAPACSFSYSVIRATLAALGE